MAYTLARIALEAVRGIEREREPAQIAGVGLGGFSACGNSHCGSHVPPYVLPVCGYIYIYVYIYLCVSRSGASARPAET